MFALTGDATSLVVGCPEGGAVVTRTDDGLVIDRDERRTLPLPRAAEVRVDAALPAPGSCNGVHRKRTVDFAMEIASRRDVAGQPVVVLLRVHIQDMGLALAEMEWPRPKPNASKAGGPQLRDRCVGRVALGGTQSTNVCSLGLSSVTYDLRAEESVVHITRASRSSDLDRGRSTIDTLVRVVLPCDARARLVSLPGDCSTRCEDPKDACYRACHVPKEPDPDTCEQRCDYARNACPSRCAR